MLMAVYTVQLRIEIDAFDTISSVRYSTSRMTLTKSIAFSKKSLFIHIFLLLFMSRI